jgi:hypothetical protein
VHFLPTISEFPTTDSACSNIDTNSSDADEAEEYKEDSHFGEPRPSSCPSPNSSAMQDSLDAEFRKSTSVYLSSMSICNIDQIQALSVVDSSAVVHISTTEGFNLSRSSPVIRSLNHPEYVTLKSKTSSQQGCHHSTYKRHQQKVIINSDNVSGHKRLRAGTIKPSELQILFEIANSFPDQKNWPEIADLFNMRTQRNEKEERSLTATQVKNTYWNYRKSADLNIIDERGCKTILNFSATFASSLLSMNSQEHDQVSEDAFSVSLSATAAEISPSMSFETSSAICANSTHSWDEIQGVQIEQAGEAQDWSEAELNILHEMNKNSMAKICNDGGKKGLSFSRVQQQYNLQARKLKLQDINTRVYLRTVHMLQNKIKSMKKQGLWK